MNSNPQAAFVPHPSSPLLRCVFAAVAVVATLATAGMIDALARSHGTPAASPAQCTPLFVAGY